MPYLTKWEDRGIRWEFFGDVTAEEIEKANKEFYNDERSDRAKYQIVDATKISTVEWNDLEIVKTAAYDIGAGHVIKNLKVAYVAHNKEIVSKIEKYIEISKRLNSSWIFKGFDDFESAREWVTSKQ